MADPVVVTIHWVLPIVVGLVIGIIEAYFVYEDENMTSGRDFLGDMWHGLLFSIVGVWIAINIPWVMLNWVPESMQGFFMVNVESGISLVACILVTLFMLVKMVASHAIKGVRGGGFTEKFGHKLVVAAAVGFSPYYILPMAPSIQAAVGPYFPDWMTF